MSQSLSKLYVHLIFHIKGSDVPIKDGDKNDLYAYIGAIIKDNKSIPILIKTKLYIQNQEEHHKKMTFKEELKTFPQEYGIEYDERYLWTD
jgi:hypothetical protein